MTEEEREEDHWAVKSSEEILKEIDDPNVDTIQFLFDYRKTRERSSKYFMRGSTTISEAKNEHQKNQNSLNFPHFLKSIGRND